MQSEFKSLPRKEKGDPLLSEEWNQVLKELERLEQEKLNTTALDNITRQPLTIKAALEVNNRLQVSTDASQLTIDSISDGTLSINFTRNRGLIRQWILGVGITRNNNDFFINDFSTEYRLVIQKGTGNLGIGVHEPTAKLQVNGNLKVETNISYGGRLNQSSSQNLKENISEISAQDAILVLSKLNPIQYDYKGQKFFRQNLGFIAEDMPDRLASEDRKSISPLEIIPVLTKVLQEQQKTIEALHNEISLLKERLDKQ